MQDPSAWYIESPPHPSKRKKGVKVKYVALTVHTDIF